MFVSAIWYDFVIEPVDYASLCWEDLWEAYENTQDEDELEVIINEIERRRDLYR